MQRIEAWKIACSLLILSVAAGAGCSDDAGGEPAPGLPLEAQTAAGQANTNLEANLDAIGAALLWLEDAEVLTDLLDQLIPTESCDPVDTPDCEPGIDFDVQSELADLAAWVAENVFNDDNVVDQSSTRITFQIPPELLCSQDDAPPDPDCLAMWEQVPIRLRVSSPAEGFLTVELLVGSGSVNPIDLRLNPSELAAEVDLGATLEAIELILGASGESIAGLGTMSGRVEVALATLGAGHVRLTASITQAIDVELDIEGQPIDLTLAASSPTAVLELDANAATLQAALDLRAMDAVLPATLLFGSETTCSAAAGEPPVCETSAAEGESLDMHLGGLSGEIALTGDSETLELSDVGLGNDTTAVRMNGGNLLTIDLNPGSGRRVNVTASAGRLGPDVSVLPQLSALVGLGFDAAGAIADEMPDWLRNDQLAVTLSGSAEPTVSFRTADASGAIEVLSGLLVVTSSARDLAIDVAEGECLWNDESESEDDHPFAGLLSGACPE